MRKKAKSNSSPAFNFPGGRTIIFVLVVVFIIALEETVKASLIIGRGEIVCNRAFAFGLGSQNSALNVTISATLILFSSLMFINAKQPTVKLGTALLVGGGVANLISRITQGCITDYINILFFPSFNIADVAITSGVGLLIISIFLKGERANA